MGGPAASAAEPRADDQAMEDATALLAALDELAALPLPEVNAPLTPTEWEPTLSTSTGAALQPLLAATSTTELLSVARGLAANSEVRSELLSAVGWGEVIASAIVAVGSTMAIVACSTTPCAIAAGVIAVGAWLIVANEAQDAARESCGSRVLRYHNPVTEDTYCYDPCSGRQWSC